MMWLIQNWRAIFAFALIVVAGLAGYNVGADSVREKWDIEKARIAQDMLAVALEVQRENTRKQEERNANLAKIDALHADNAALRKRLRLPTPTCTGSVSTTGQADDNATGTGELQPEVPSCAEEALRRFDELWDEEAIRADRIVEECRAL